MRTTIGSAVGAGLLHQRRDLFPVPRLRVPDEADSRVNHLAEERDDVLELGERVGGGAADVIDEPFGLPLDLFPRLLVSLVEVEERRVFFGGARDFGHDAAGVEVGAERNEERHDSAVDLFRAGEVDRKTAFLRLVGDGTNLFPEGGRVRHPKSAGEADRVVGRFDGEGVPLGCFRVHVHGSSTSRSIDLRQRNARFSQQPRMRQT